MKVLFVCPTVPREPFNGYELLLAQRARFLPRDVELYVLFCGREKQAPVDQAWIQERFQGVHYLAITALDRVIGLAGSLLNGTPLQTGLYPAHCVTPVLQALVRDWKIDLIDLFLMRMYGALAGSWPIPIVCTMVDSMSLNMQRRQVHERFPRSWLCALEATRCVAYERQIAQAGHRINVVAPADAAAFAAAGERVQVIPLGVDTETYQVQPPGWPKQWDVIFTGNMYYFPNVQAACWFAEHCWPLVRRKLPAATFAIAGNRPAEAILSLNGTNGISVLGRVDSMAAVIGSSQVAIAPMRSGSGLQIKILEALSCGLSVVASTLAVQPLGEGRPDALKVADSAAEMADVIIGLISGERRGAARASGRAFVLERFSWGSVTASVHGQYLAALQDGAETNKTEFLPSEAAKLAGWDSR